MTEIEDGTTAAASIGGAMRWKEEMDADKVKPANIEVGDSEDGAGHGDVMALCGCSPGQHA